MWLLNHTTARKFEIPMLKSLGFEEIFLPKKIPSDVGFRSASIDFSEDENLSIPPSDLAALNAADWYAGPPADVWSIANRHFDIAFFILHHVDLLSSLAKHFSGAAIWRAYGIVGSTSYSRNLQFAWNGSAWKDIRKLGSRFWFGEAYDQLGDIERRDLRSRRVHLPLGLAPEGPPPVWTGTTKKLFFVCPEIRTNPYYAAIYQEFRTEFSEFDYVIGGSQPLAVGDPQVLGFVTAEEHRRNMSGFRVMFYHSSEPNHVHYHPFEAVNAGMPLVFMSGGLLDRLGGKDLPGRCTSIAQAQGKIRRILNDDRGFIEQVRSSQRRLLAPMAPERCRPFWERGMARIVAGLDEARSVAKPAILQRTKRVAVLAPAHDHESDRLAGTVAAALRAGGTQFGENVEVVVGRPDRAGSDDRASDVELPDGVTSRPCVWRYISGIVARRAMYYAGYDDWSADANRYLFPDDGIKQFYDCDLWFLVSDRLQAPLLPVRPYVLLVDSYPQRHAQPPAGVREMAPIVVARRAERVLVTSELAARDAKQFAGVVTERVRRVPVLSPQAGDPPLAAQQYWMAVSECL
ncbi:MAG: glycosytransferase [Xanthobacteraceae bacterium]